MIPAEEEQKTAPPPAPAELSDAEGPARLARFLSHQDPDLRLEAARLLGKMGATAAPAVPALIAVLRDRNLKLRLAATTALGAIGAAAEPAVPALATAMTDSHIIVARLAAQSLSRIGGAAIAALVGLLYSNDCHVRREAAWALGELGPAIRQTTTTATPPPIPASLIDTTPDRRRAITPVIPLSREDIVVDPATISALPSPPIDPIQALTAAMRDNDPKVRAAAAEALQRITSA
jgi:HEAT repeat protein